jgi:hypothetical protein
LLGFFHVGNSNYVSPQTKRKPVEQVTTWVR